MKLLIEADVAMCPYWDADSKQAKHICRGCERDSSTSRVMVDGDKYCLLDVSIVNAIKSKE